MHGGAARERREREREIRWVVEGGSQGVTREKKRRRHETLFRYFGCWRQYQAFSPVTSNPTWKRDAATATCATRRAWLVIAARPAAAMAQACTARKRTDIPAATATASIRSRPGGVILFVPSHPFFSSFARHQKKRRGKATPFTPTPPPPPPSPSIFSSFAALQNQTPTRPFRDAPARYTILTHVGSHRFLHPERRGGPRVPSRAKAHPLPPLRRGGAGRNRPLLPFPSSRAARSDAGRSGGGAEEECVKVCGRRVGA